MMTISQQLILVALCAAATMLTRFLPFMVFRENKETPEFVKYISKYIPSAVFGMLIIYCLKGIDFAAYGGHGIPELLAALITILIHLWKRNTLLSIGVGTVSYMILIHLIIF